VKPIAPDRKERKKCWEARDAFFECLDKNGIIDSIKRDKEAKAQCGKQHILFEKDCVPSWVEYFKKRRVMEDKREKQLKELRKQGAEEMPVNAESARR